ncbi:dTMP kinase [Comamonas serinivorans]|uniref:Thymidylate kinase n=1 Tax=Comamonas serinivorans TaxID=1082851 RepID=A0A1Y0ETI1_9BURK|nr:dTMP kinase [Comamonas serinivorans]ARU06838.1 dTMP kinase [Comamonas serinivorans]
MSSTRAHFISFEGIDGAGKSTHIAALADALRAAGHTVVLTREPGGTPLAERLRELVLHEAMSPLTEALLMFAARRDHLDTVIEPALASGSLVLCDRFTDATFAYQGAGRGFDWDTLAQLERMVQASRDGVAADGGAALRQPDVTLWFDLSPHEAAQRLAKARVPDRFESQPEAFFDAVRSGYARRMAAAPQRVVRIDSDQPRAQVREQVLRAAQQRQLLTPDQVSQALAATGEIS